MRKLVIRLTIALLTFSIGFGIAGLWAVSRFRHAEELSIPKVIISEVKLAPDVSNVSERWKKIDIKGQFSFYLPPNVEEMRPPNIPSVDGAFHGRVGSLGDDFLYLNYVYSKRASCEIVPHPQNWHLSEMSEVVIGGKKARLSIWQAEEGEVSFIMDPYEITLCFPDAGHGKKKLHLYASASDLQAVEVIRQIFNSIEFH